LIKDQKLKNWGGVIFYCMYKYRYYYKLMIGCHIKIAAASGQNRRKSSL